jgi:hypothetical protein
MIGLRVGRGRSAPRPRHVRPAARHPRTGTVLRRRAARDAGDAGPLQPPPLDRPETPAAAHRAAAVGRGQLVRRATHAALGGARRPAVHERGVEPRQPLPAHAEPRAQALRRLLPREPAPRRQHQHRLPARLRQPQHRQRRDRNLVQLRLAPPDVPHAGGGPHRTPPGAVQPRPVARHAAQGLGDVAAGGHEPRFASQGRASRTGRDRPVRRDARRGDRPVEQGPVDPAPAEGIVPADHGRPGGRARRRRAASSRSTTPARPAPCARRA